MRTLDETTGPWVGWSVQYNRKIHERLALSFGGGRVAGTGEDADGDFVVEGDYEASGEVAIVRRYTYCTLGSEGVGIPYLYRGRWDGVSIAGEWRPVYGAYDGGPFEIWPDEPSTEIRELMEREPEVAGSGRV